MRMRNLLIGLACLCLPMLLQACSTRTLIKPVPTEIRVPVYVPLPDVLTAPVPVPVLEHHESKDCREPLGIPPETILNCDISNHVAELDATIARANWQLGQIRAKQPKAGAR